MIAEVAARRRAVAISRGRSLAASGRGRDLRERAGLSVTLVAQACGTSSSTVCGWETGRCLPRGERAVRYFELFEHIANDSAPFELFEHDPAPAPASEPHLATIAVSVPRAAELLDVSADTVYRWVANGVLPRVPHLSIVRIPVAALEAFANSGQVAA